MPVNDARTVYTRKALNQSLQGIWQHPLTVVEAPMGYGKTTAVREFLRNSTAEVFWQTVFEASPAAFWKGFCGAVAKADPACAGRLAALGLPDDSVLREEAVELLGGMKFTRPAAVVIDDYHLLSLPAVDHFVERLAAAAIPGLHIIILSRNKFGENTTELALKGYCLVIGRRQFELSVDETVDYCKLCGIRLEREEAAFLEEYTEGWISAVYLCILGYRQTGRLERQPASLHDLVDKVVYQPCTAEMKEFLTVISVYDGFSLDQAEHLWQKGNAGELLAQLIASNTFITVDPASGTYTLHNILNGYLRRIFGRQDLEKRQAVWRTAGEWYLAAGDHNHAMDFFFQAREFDRLMTAIETCDLNSFACQPREAREAYFRECPPEVRARHPGAGVQRYYNLLLINEPVLAEDQYREVNGYLENCSCMDDWLLRQIKGILEFLRAFSAFNDLAAMGRHYQAALDLLQGPAVLLNKSGAITFWLPSLLYLFYRESGGLAATVGTMKEIEPVYHRVVEGHGIGVECLLEAERHYYTGDFDNAEIFAHKALHMAEAARETAITLGADFLLIRLALVRGDWASVRRGLQRLRERINRQSLYSYIHTLDMCEGLIFACLDERDRIPAWLADGKLPAGMFYCGHGFCHIIRARALLAGGWHRELIGITGQLAADAAFYPNLLALIYIHIAEAAALDRLGRRQEALDTLGKAVAIAAPDKVIMPFVESGEYACGLLGVLQPASPHREFIGAVLKAAPPITRKWREIKTRLAVADGRSRLTRREAEIAGLVAAGLSNQAVGAQLNIVEDTVKKTLQKIFQKLGVSNRAMLARMMTEDKL